MDRVVKKAKRMAKHDMPVLLLGDSGTGKEVLARALHLESKRKGAFIAVNCAAIPKELLPSELFGYTEGAFTGAKKGGRVGKFQAAEKGTLFLDEIGELSLDAQAILLRALEEGGIMPLDENKTRMLDVRIIAATNQDLQAAVEQKQFRLDLYHRLAVLPLVLPPLASRKKDIPLIANHIVDSLGKEYGEQKYLSASLLQVLQNEPWPGNIRELKNILQALYVLADGPEITLVDYMAMKNDSHHAPAEASLCFKDYERLLIEEAFVRHGGKVVAIAQALGLSRATLYRKLANYGIKF